MSVEPDNLSFAVNAGSIVNFAPINPPGIACSNSVFPEFIDVIVATIGLYVQF